MAACETTQLKPIYWSHIFAIHSLIYAILFNCKTNRALLQIYAERYRIHIICQEIHTIEQLPVFNLTLVPSLQSPEHRNRLLRQFVVYILGHSQSGAGPAQPALVDATLSDAFPWS